MRGGEGGSECPGRPALRSGQPAAPPTSAAAEPRGPGSGSITSGDGFSGRGDPGGMPGSVVCALDPLLGSSGGRVKVRVKFWAAGGICLPRQTDSPLAPLRPGNGSWAQTSRAGRGRVTDKEIEAERRSECPQEQQRDECHLTAEYFRPSAVWIAAGRGRGGDTFMLTPELTPKIT
uniref:Uncharacterized protein LOC110211545 isoform X3 n=1 Tax=Phascolarctos cinereus TaxID=38626 RepID=A0A6P5KPC4_PHACI|nr:uncharacterized protein LOC110211545 isoform X3 [Phascolarctos cinereus]